MPKKPPQITVLMSAYNAENTVSQSIESILSQIFTNFEFIIFDDGSTDSTKSIVESYAAKDKRIVSHSHKNIGLTKTLNKGIQLAKGQYIGRQDADDVSYPTRLGKQIELMDASPDILVCGSNCDNIYPDGTKTQWGWENTEALNKSVFYKTPFAHSTALIRTTDIKEMNGYNEQMKTAQDAELWMRFAERGKIAMLQEPLLLRRVSMTSISKSKQTQQFSDVFKARMEHNKGLRKLIALFYLMRLFIIENLPTSLFKFIKANKA